MTSTLSWYPTHRRQEYVVYLESNCQIVVDHVSIIRAVAKETPLNGFKFDKIHRLPDPLNIRRVELTFSSTFKNCMFSLYVPVIIIHMWKNIFFVPDKSFEDLRILADAASSKQ